MTGYGTSGQGSSTTGPNWNDSAYAHCGYNSFDVTSDADFGAWDAANPGAGTSTPPTFGHTYVTDFDPPSSPRHVAAASDREGAGKGLERPVSSAPPTGAAVLASDA